MSAFSTEVLGDSPLVYLKLDDTSGSTAADSSGNSKNGSYTGSPTLPGATPVTDGTAVSFVAGSSQEVTVNDASLAVATTCSIEISFKNWTAGTALVRDHTSANGWIIGFDSSNTFAVRIGGLTINTTRSTAQMQDDKEHNLLVTKNGATVKIYIDGVLDTTSTSAGNTAAIMPWHLARNGNGGAYTTVTLDEFAIYSTELTAADVVARFNNCTPARFGAYGKQNQAGTSQGSGTSLAITTIAANVGDYLVAFVSDRSYGAMAAPSGWTRIDSDPGSGSLIAAYYRKVDGTESGSYTWTVASDRARGVMVRFVGVDGTTPFEGATRPSNTTSTTTIALPSITPSKAGCYYVGAASAASTVNVGFTPPGGMREVQESGGGSTASITVAEELQSGTSATGTRTFTAGSSNNLWAVAFLARPATLTQTVTPSGLASAEAFGTAVVTRGAVSVAPSGIATAFAAGTAKVTLYVLPSGIATAFAAGTAVVAGRYTITGTGIASAEAFGTTTVTGTGGLSPSGIASAEAFGGATVTPGVASVAPSGIATGFAAGTLTVNQHVVATGIASGEAFGSDTLTVVVHITPSGIASAGAFGTLTIANTNTQFISNLNDDDPIGHDEEFGVATIFLATGPSPPIGSDDEGAGFGVIPVESVVDISVTPERRAVPGFFRIKLTSLYKPADTINGTHDIQLAKTVAYLSDFADASVTIPINEHREATVKISMGDPACEFIRPYAVLLHMTWVTPFGSYLVFWGIVTKPVWNPADFTVTLPAVDMSLRMQHHYVRFGDRILKPNDDEDLPNAYNSFKGKSHTQGVVPSDANGIEMLLDCAQIPEWEPYGIPPLGVTMGANTATIYSTDTSNAIQVNRGDQVWDTIISLVAGENAPDIDLIPVDSEVGLYAVLNTYGLLQNDRSQTCIWQDGFGKDNAAITYEPGGVVANIVHSLSTNDEFRASAFDIDSMSEIGVYVMWDRTSIAVKDHDRVQEEAQQQVTAYGKPPDFLSVEPDLDCGLYFLDDFYTGDLVRAAVRSGNLRKDIIGEVRSTTLRQMDSAGNVGQQIEVVPTLAGVTEGDDES